MHKGQVDAQHYVRGGLSQIPHRLLYDPNKHSYHENLLINFFIPFITVLNLFLDYESTSPTAEDANPSLDTIDYWHFCFVSHFPRDSPRIFYE